MSIYGERLADMSKWIDEFNSHRDPEAVTWGRLGKIAEEGGEVIEAYIGYSAQNPRKGKTHELDDVLAELLDVAITALGAYEHLDGHRGDSMSALRDKIDAVVRRAGLEQVGIMYTNMTGYPSDRPSQRGGTVKLHEPGECPDTYYGSDCNGIGYWDENPYDAEINNDHTKGWICDGVAYGVSQDI